MHRKLRASCATFILAPPLFDIFLSANQPVGDGASTSRSDIAKATVYAQFVGEGK